MTTRDRKDIESALVKKGFDKDDTHHHCFIYKTIAGQITDIRTRTSHGSGHKTIGDPLLGQMAKQVRLTKSQFLELVDCPMDRVTYEGAVREFL